MCWALLICPLGPMGERGRGKWRGRDQCYPVYPIYIRCCTSQSDHYSSVLWWLFISIWAFTKQEKQAQHGVLSGSYNSGLSQSLNILPQANTPLWWHREADNVYYTVLWVVLNEAELMFTVGIKGCYFMLHVCRVFFAWSRAAKYIVSALTSQSAQPRHHGIASGRLTTIRSVYVEAWVVSR